MFRLRNTSNNMHNQCSQQPGCLHYNKILRGMMHQSPFAKQSKTDTELNIIYDSDMERVVLWKNEEEWGQWHVSRNGDMQRHSQMASFDYWVGN